MQPPPPQSKALHPQEEMRAKRFWRGWWVSGAGTGNICNPLGSSRPRSCSPFSHLLLLSARPALRERLPLGTSVTLTSVLPLAQLKSSHPHGSKSLKPSNFSITSYTGGPPKCAKNLHSCVSVSSLALRDRKPTLKGILSQSNWDKLTAVFVDFTWSCSGTSKLIPKELSSKAAAALTTFKVKFEGVKKKRK